MCSPVKCRTCGKTTWSGCGNHVAAVKSMVPANQWCEGHADAQPVGSGFFSKMFSR